MKKRWSFVLPTAVFFLFFAALGVQCTKMQSGQQTERVREMTVTGEIGEGYTGGYIIRGKTPSMVMTILNPEPEILDELVKNEKTVEIDVWIVSGDNVKIIAIDGKGYPRDMK